MPLNDLCCENAKPQSKVYRLSDGEGLYLFVLPNGRKYWRLKYKFNDKENSLSLGSYSKVSLEDARIKRDKAKTDLKAGNDPSLLRREAKQLAAYNSSQTFEGIAREWHTRYIDNWSPKQAARILRRLENEIFPDIGRYPINKLPRKVFLACLQKAAARSAELGKRLFGYCRQIFAFAGLTDRLERDLTSGVKAALPKYIAEHFACIELEELPDFIKAIYAEPPEQHKLVNQALRLLMLFACRTMELLKAERSEFDLDNRLWIIKSNRVKKSSEQRRIKKDHLVPLSKQALKILLELDEKYGIDRKFLLPSPIKDDQAVCKNIFLDELDRLGYKSIMTAHGFRSLFMGVSTEKLKYDIRVPDRQLGHVPKNEVLRAYDRAKYLDERIELMQKFADYLDKQIPLVKKEVKTENLYLNSQISMSYIITTGYKTYYHP